MKRGLGADVRRIQCVFAVDDVAVKGVLRVAPGAQTPKLLRVRVVLSEQKRRVPFESQMINAESLLIDLYGVPFDLA